MIEFEALIILLAIAGMGWIAWWLDK